VTAHHLPHERTPDADERRYVAFLGDTLIASGDAASVARAARRALPRASRGAVAPLLIFDAVTSQPLELDLRGSDRDVLARLTTHPTLAAARAFAQEAADAAAGRDLAHAPRGPGRPRLGVVPREVTLLPRHWEWLAEQPGGASAALRRLVEQALRSSAPRDRQRRALDAAYRFMSAMLGDQPQFEEAARALFALDDARFTTLTRRWPADPRDHVRQLARTAFHP
jgi:hypothetical protein